jgi:hypothetical protein
MLGALFESMPVPANSDFYPFVDLTAPRMRFLNRDALDLVRLSLLPVPLAEIFGQPLGHPASPSQISARSFTRHQKAIEARSIVSAVVARDSGRAPAGAREAVAAVAATACRDPAARAAWLEGVHTLSSRTTPFLTVADRAPMWMAVRESGCSAALSPAENSWLALLEASARGDARAIAAEGERLFTAALPDLNGNQVLEALITTVAAQSAIGKHEDARGLLGAYLPVLGKAGEYSLALRLVESQELATGLRAR